MSLKNQLNNDLINVFLNEDEFAESITYTPKGGSPKTLSAIVNRQRLIPASETTGRILTNQIEIIIANDSAYGVTSINKGGDQVALPERIGEAAINWIVADVLDHDAGGWHLLLTK